MEFDAAVLHDFFVDRLVFVGDFDRFLRTIRRKVEQGGGGIRDVKQVDIRGGNAVNFTHALARLGDRVFLIAQTDENHERLLRSTFRGLKVHSSLRRRPAGLTVALEGRSRGRSVNVMMSDRRGAGEFSSSSLTETDWVALEKSSIVCVVNWAANLRGNELVQGLRSNLRKGKKIFFDPADVRDTLGRYRILLGLIRRKRVVDWVSLNRFEAELTGKILGVGGRGTRQLCERIARDLNVRVDVHTEESSVTSDGHETVSHRTLVVTPMRLTGAGDVWDAASVHFHLRGKTELMRITLADTAARLYVSSESADPPNELQILSEAP